MKRKYPFDYSIITCKYFALLFFLPLLLTREKRIWRILLETLVAGSLYIIETLLYLPSEAYRTGVLGFGAVGYIFDAQIDAGHVSISICVVAFLLVCGIAYFHVDSDKDVDSWGIYLLNLVTYICFGLSFWHPQWLLLAVPVWVVGTVMSDKMNVFLLFDVLLMLFYVIFIVFAWKTGLGAGLFSGGILATGLKLDTSLLNQNLTMEDMFPIDDQLVFPCFSAVLLLYTLFKHPKFQSSNIDIDKSLGISRFRYVVGPLIFILPSLICVYINYTKPTVVFSTGNPVSFLGASSNDLLYEQGVILQDIEMTGIQFYFGGYGRINDCIVNVDVVDEALDQIVAQASAPANHFKDCDYTQLDFTESLLVEGEKKYIIQLYCTNVLPDCSNAIALTYSDDGTSGNAVVGGEEMNYTLALRVVGKRGNQ